MRAIFTYGRHGWTRDQVEQLTTLFREGKQAKDIAIKVNKSLSSVQSKLIYLGLYRRESTMSKDIELEILNRLRLGESPNTIRKAIKVSYPSIKRVQLAHSVDNFSSPKLTDIQAAYLAGIIDGEGCIMLNLRKQNTLPQIILAMANTHFGLVDYLRDMSGCGSILDHPKQGNRRPQRRWVAYQRCAIELLRQLRPYMICKRAQTDIVLRYYDKYVTNHPWEYSEQERASILNMIESVHLLNKRGLK